ncbi:MAG TPA: hypothetical protein H9728_00740 [Candidatus Borkfalkia excrementavium]|uniref:Nucleoside transporter/FeoB GTPase Gate domain-containing protein n=1 Tax=Candidatus Borkfalkia excrementavium TaxID=2838505 RepID=A0A9D2CF69_9FIRM|nr:hypothetical protein [Candidatus Borkfalkia excrementavium]
MTWAAYILPVAFIGVILIAALRKVRVYDSFAEGIKGAIPLVLSLFPYIAAILILTELFDASGLSDRLNEALSPAFSFLGIPPEISRLVLLKPFSGSGSTAVLSEIFAKYGADSYISRCAAVVYASGETVFYVSAVYFAGSKNKAPAGAVVIALAANLVAVAIGCLVCRIL